MLQLPRLWINEVTRIYVPECSLFLGQRWYMLLLLIRARFQGLLKTSESGPVNSHIRRLSVVLMFLLLKTGHAICPGTPQRSNMSAGTIHIRLIPKWLIFSTWYFSVTFCVWKSCAKQNKIQDFDLRWGQGQTRKLNVWPKSLTDQEQVLTFCGKEHGFEAIRGHGISAHWALCVHRQSGTTSCMREKHNRYLESCQEK